MVKRFVRVDEIPITRTSSYAPGSGSINKLLVPGSFYLVQNVIEWYSYIPGQYWNPNQQSRLQFFLDTDSAIRISTGNMGWYGWYEWEAERFGVTYLDQLPNNFSSVFEETESWDKASWSFTYFSFLVSGNVTFLLMASNIIPKIVNFCDEPWHFCRFGMADVMRPVLMSWSFKHSAWFFSWAPPKMSSKYDSIVNCYGTNFRKCFLNAVHQLRT